MAQSPYTGIEHIEPNQAQKEVTANDGFDRISNFVAETLVVTISGDELLTETEFQEAFHFELNGTPGAGFLFEVPSTVKKSFIVNNASGQTATVQVVGGGGASVDVDDGSQFYLYSDGTDVISAGGGSGGGEAVKVSSNDTTAAFLDTKLVAGTNVSLTENNDGGNETLTIAVTDLAFDVGTFIGGQPGASELVLQYLFARTVVFASGLTNSRGYAATAPADAAKDFDVQKNGASVGTVSFAQSSNTATFTMASQQTFNAGDRLELVAPGTQDSAMADISITLVGTK